MRRTKEDENRGKYYIQSVGRKLSKQFFSGSYWLF